MTWQRDISLLIQRGTVGCPAVPVALSTPDKNREGVNGAQRVVGRTFSLQQVPMGKSERAQHFAKENYWTGWGRCVGPQTGRKHQQYPQQYAPASLSHPIVEAAPDGRSCHCCPQINAARYDSLCITGRRPPTCSTTGKEHLSAKLQTRQEEQSTSKGQKEKGSLPASKQKTRQTPKSRRSLAKSRAAVAPLALGATQKSLRQAQ